jgi:hypothetical protein
MGTHEEHISRAGFEVLTAVVMKISIFWDITLCGPLKINRRFGGICRLQLQARKIGQERYQREARSDHKDGGGMFSRTIS